MNRDDAITLLLKKKRCADSRSLVHASKHGNIDLVRLCLDAGVGINEPGPSGETPLEVAVRGHRVEVARLLLERGASVAVPLILFNAVYAAAFNEGTELVELVLQAGASQTDVEATTGFTALQLAQDMGYKEAEQLLRAQNGA